MSNLPDFKTRVQFSFGAAPSGISDDTAVLYDKVAEMFQTKKKLGSLKYWLLELAYEAAEKELALENGIQSRVSAQVFDSDEVVPQRVEKAEQLAVKVDQPVEVVADNERGASQPLAHKARVGAIVPPSGLQPRASRVPRVHTREVGGGMEESWMEVEEELDMSIYAPKSLSGDVTAKKRVEMPQSMRNLVLKT